MGCLCLAEIGVADYSKLVDRREGLIWLRSGRMLRLKYVFTHFVKVCQGLLTLVLHQAPHHSRASWMKFWRRHKHEFSRADTDAPLPQPPEKKMRYSRDDDILLAKYFFDKPEGTSDKVFQAFGRMVSPFVLIGWLVV